MRRAKVGMLLAIALGAGACGGGTQFANNPRPAIPVNLAVYIDDARVAVSPSTVGAGPVSFLVTNQASHTESLTIARAANGAALANTGPIDPQATAQLTVDFDLPGQYTVSAGTGALTDAQRTTPSPIHPATLHIGHHRASSDNGLLQP